MFMVDRIDTILSFLKEIGKFKNVEREIWTSDLKRKESDAEHSWHLAMFLILFEKDLPKDLDFAKTLKLALMHDLVEIYAGDTFAFDNDKRSTKKEREAEAAEKLFSRLPDDLCEEFKNYFEEYEKGETNEAKIVKSFDKLQPILQNLCSEGKAWKEHGLTLSDVDNYKRKFVEHDDFILGIYEKLLDEAKKEGLIQTR